MSQMEVNHGGENTVENVQNEKYFTKNGDFYNYMLTFACVIDVLMEQREQCKTCLSVAESRPKSQKVISVALICSTKVSEISDMDKS